MLCSCLLPPLSTTACSPVIVSTVVPYPVNTGCVHLAIKGRGVKLNHSPSAVPSPQPQGWQYAFLSIQVMIRMNGRHLTLITLVNKHFVPRGKMSVCVFLDAEFKCFQNVCITHTFRVASDYVKAQAYICESLGACRR